MTWLWLLGIVALLFGLTVFRGAPYVPTHRRSVERALDLLHLKPGDVVIDLGSGDGVFLQAAAKRGLTAYGYEINPLLCLVAWLRCWQYRKQVKIRWRDFWLTAFPPQTKGVFIFAGGPFMKHLAHKLAHEAKTQQFYVVSYGFEIPGCTVIKKQHGLHLYKFENK